MKKLDGSILNDWGLVQSIFQAILFHRASSSQTLSLGSVSDGCVRSNQPVRKWFIQKGGWGRKVSYPHRSGLKVFYVPSNSAAREYIYLAAIAQVSHTHNSIIGILVKNKLQTWIRCKGSRRIPNRSIFNKVQRKDVFWFSSKSCPGLRAFRERILQGAPLANKRFPDTPGSKWASD